MLQFGRKSLWPAVSILKTLRRRRDARVGRYLARQLLDGPANLYVFRPSAVWLCARLVISLFLLWLFIQLGEPLAGVFDAFFAFFRLAEIFRFDAPDHDFFYLVAFLFLVLLGGYHWLAWAGPMTLRSLQTLVVDRTTRRLYVLRQRLVFREIEVMSLSEIVSTRIRRFFPAAWFGLSVVEIHTVDKRSLFVPGLPQAGRFARLLSET